MAHEWPAREKEKSGNRNSTEPVAYHSMLPLELHESRSISLASGSEQASSPAMLLTSVNQEFSHLLSIANNSSMLLNVCSVT
jgi:hypothetical protein